MAQAGAILVVDDDPDVLSVAVGVLTARGYEVFTVGTSHSRPGIGKVPAIYHRAKPILRSNR